MLGLPGAESNARSTQGARHRKGDGVSVGITVTIASAPLAPTMCQVLCALITSVLLTTHLSGNDYLHAHITEKKIEGWRSQITCNHKAHGEQIQDLKLGYPSPEARKLILNDKWRTECRGGGRPVHGHQAAMVAEPPGVLPMCPPLYPLCLALL